MNSFKLIEIQSKTVLIIYYSMEIDIRRRRFVFNDSWRRFSYDNFCFSEEQSRRYSTKRLDMLKDHELNLRLNIRNIVWI